MPEQSDPTLHWDTANSRWLRWDGATWNPVAVTPPEQIQPEPQLQLQVHITCPACQQPTLVNADLKGWTCASCAADSAIIECPWCRIISPWQDMDKVMCGFCLRMAQRSMKLLVQFRGATAETLAGWQTWFGAPPGAGSLITGGRVLQATNLPFPPTSIVIIGINPESATVTFTGLDNTTARPGVQVRKSDSDLTGVWMGGRGEYQQHGDYTFEYGVFSMIPKHDRTQTSITIDYGNARLDLTNETVPTPALGRWLGPLAARVPQQPSPAAVAVPRVEQLPAPVVPEESDRNYVTVLNELAHLHEQGILTDEEFAEKKADVLRRV